LLRKNYELFALLKCEHEWSDEELKLVQSLEKEEMKLAKQHGRKPASHAMQQLWEGKPTPVTVMKPAVEFAGNLIQFAKEVRQKRRGPWTLGKDETTLDAQMGNAAKELKEKCQKYWV